MKAKIFLKTTDDNRFILLSDSDINDVFKELEQKINKLREDENIEEKIDDLEEIEKQTRLMREEGLIPENSTKEVCNGD